MNWFGAVDYYCERIAAGFGAEPFNMLTGLCFLLVGAIALRRAPRAEDRWAAAALGLVGLASAVQHGFAVMLTIWIDLAANLLYLTLLGVLLLRRLAGARVAVAGLAAMTAVAIAHLGGSSVWLRSLLGPAADTFFFLFVLLVILALAVRAQHPATSNGIALAAAFLALGLPFRFLDHGLCASWPLGTHGIWHLCNAAACAVLLSVLARHPQPGDAPRL